MAAPEHFPVMAIVLLLLMGMTNPGRAEASPPRETRWLETSHFRIKWQPRRNGVVYGAAFRKKELPAPSDLLGRMEVFEAIFHELRREDLQLGRRALHGEPEAVEALGRRLDEALRAWERICRPEGNTTNASPLGPAIDRASVATLAHRAALVVLLGAEDLVPRLEKLRDRVTDPPLRQDLEGALTAARGGRGLPALRSAMPALEAFFDELGAPER